MKQKMKISVHYYYMLGIGFPIYFREPPGLVYDLLEKIDGRNRRLFFFVTKGLYSGNAVKNIMEFSISRNFRPVGSIEFFMPGTDFLILFARKDSFMEKFLKRIHSRNIDAKIDSFFAKGAGGRAYKKTIQKVVYRF